MKASEFGLTDEELAHLETIYKENLFESKRVVISGGGSGIGLSIAWLCGRLGAEVVLLGRDQEKLCSACDKLAKHGVKAAAYSLTIRSAEQVDATLRAIVTDHGEFDILINSAGGQFPQPAMDISPKGWNAVVDTNLNGTWYMMQSSGRLWMEQQRPGVVVNIVTVVDRGMVDMVHSAAARAGVIAATKTLAVEWAPYGIRLNCVAPGVIASEGMRVYSDAARQQFPNSNPMKRFGSPWEIAQSAIYLASDASSFTTGDIMTVDGGGRLWGELWPFRKPDYFQT
ncbi:SDR family oxidoreductase [Aestuariicella hydrocarbonica]|uniref:Peroxisomal trans-2-enoyl-CoA reductase n=1 Tax=Pseudomaricurvus hydrocarbonicus TaxID=1470433 RepID=A0A9E5MLK3_9GAMM|nr:SDR family oxidoreductase [Aestuariicella hydrocarbonica]NHO64763.1 SDR family oxidoreductase [Aestuariicella hydrocarbonica]